MSFFLLILTVLCWLLIIYHHVVYPLILRHIQKRITHTLPGDPRVDIDFKSITILVPAYNEADVIADKIRNVAALDYPADRLKLVIACDGCQDGTALIAHTAAQEPENSGLNIEILDFEKNQGKVAILNHVIKQLDTDIVALSDASALISMDGLKIANQHFSNTEVAVVAATYRLLNPGSAGENSYWKYQTGVKQGEAAMGSPIGVHGALYFFSRPLFKALKPDTINDDFILPMQMVAAGYAAVYDCNIIALELEHADLGMDQRRRVRIAAGNMQQLLRLPALLSPRQRGTAFAFLSGKALRTLMPFIILIQLLLCAVLSQESVYFLLLLLAEVSTISLARLSLLLPEKVLSKSRFTRPINLIFYLVNGYFSSLIGNTRYLLGLERGCWKPVANKEISS
jgi:cellulose synthase/poly-beta-1,6-N-acetylglucosamine synthase-like glycosyltransferase